MLVPNDPQATPEWSLPERCRCECVCANRGMTLDQWLQDPRRYCGCCAGSCGACAHGITQPLGWDGDQA